MKGIVSSFQSLGTLDGPGVRAVVFAAGCPLRCIYCHNPETWEMKGEEVDAETLVQKILRFKPFIKNGGVTFSGGEPLLQGAFFAEVAERLKKENLHVALDTSGNFSDNSTERLVRAVDLIILDVKFVSESDYKKYTGGSLEKTLAFLALAKRENKRVWIRQVVVKGLTDSDENVRKLKEILRPFSDCIDKIEFLPFRKICLEKYDRINIDFPLKNLEETDTITLDRMNAVLAENNS